MATDFNAQLETQKTSENKLNASTGKVANFCYTNQAFTEDEVAGVETYSYAQEQNIPIGDDTCIQMSAELLFKGLRSQASSITRMAVNHFFGRCSYNINKLSKHLYDFMIKVQNYFRESNNAWSPTALYKKDDIVYFMTEQNNAPCKRTFVCILDCPGADYPPVYTDGSLINTDYWKEVSGNFAGITTTGATVNGNLNVNGNIYQSGTPYETHAEQLYTKKDNIITRDGAQSAMASDEYSGFRVHNYDGDGKAGILAFRSDGTAVVGDIDETETGSSAELQPLLTRAESEDMQNGAQIIWDALNQRAITSSVEPSSKYSNTFICTQAANAIKTIVISQELTNELTIKVLFLNGHYSTETADIMTLNGKKIYVNKFGSASLFKGHTLRDDAGKFWYMQGYTTLELVYMTSLDDGNGGWLIIGNPVVLSNSTDTESYEVKADGLIEQQGNTTLTGIVIITYPVIFLKLPFVINNTNENNVALDHRNIGYAVSVKDFTFNRGASGTIRIWYARGY